MDIKTRMDKVIQYIGEHLDDVFTLSDLSQVACFSEYHFHRLFTAYTGGSLQSYIRWLRMKRAAHQLVLEHDKSILDIAVQAGFESHEAFTRAFKRSCGSTPKDFRAQASWQVWEKPPYSLTIREDIEMNVTIKTQPARRLAVIEHRGDPAGIGNSVRELTAWARSQPMNLKPELGEAFGFAYDDPKTVEPEAFRFDLGITVPEQTKVSGNIIEKRLPAGRYAVVLHKGSRENIGDAVYMLYRDWLPGSGEELGDLPCLFSYYNFEHEVAETELITECWLLLK